MLGLCVVEEGHCDRDLEPAVGDLRAGSAATG
jgi:hypothetical protein